MTNTKNTKRALLASTLALILCFAMLLGTTYAWFTDGVTSANNIITAGNLDIELEYAKVVDGQMTEWAPVEGEDEIFDPNALWEPGRYEVVYLRVKNLGSLALKYQLSLNIYNEVAGVNVYGEEFKLSDYLVFATVEETGDLTTYADREAALAATNGKTMGMKDYTGATTELEVGGIDHVALIVYMPTEVGNAANYATGTTAPSISFGINLVATQNTVEKDSFGNDYDAVTMVTNAAQLKAAVEAGGEVIVMNDINVDANSPIVVAANKAVVLDMNGHTINGVSTETGKNRALFTVKGEMNVIGNGTISFSHAGENMGWGNLTAPISVEGGAVTLNEGITVVNYGGTNMAYGVDVNTTGGETVLNVNGATVLSTYTAVRIFNNHKTLQGTVNYTSGMIAGDSRDIWVHNPSASAVDANGIVNIDGAYTYTTTVQDTSYNGRIYNFDYGYTLVNSASALQTALNNAVDGDVIKLGVDIKGDVTAVQKADTKVTIDGNGKTFAGVLLVDGKSATYTSAGLTIKNVVFKANSISADACVRLGNGTNETRYTCNVTVENCTFDVPGAVGVKSYTGGDKNVSIINCTATANAHSLAQLKGVDGVLVEGCEVYSKNGINFNNSDNVVVDNCTVDVKGYAVRFGESSGGTGAAETYTIKNCTLASACNDGDAVIILRGTADNSTLTIENTTITGTNEIANTATNATVVR